MSSSQIVLPLVRVMSKTLGSTAVYAYTTLISVIICVPLALMAEGSTLVAGAEKAIAAVGPARFWGDLFAVGLLYHLYNQVRGSCDMMRSSCDIAVMRGSSSRGLPFPSWPDSPLLRTRSLRSTRCSE